MTENLTKQLRIVTKAQVSYVLSDSTHFRQQWFPSRPQGIFTGSQLFMQIKAANVIRVCLFVDKGCPKSQTKGGAEWKNIEFSMTIQPFAF